MELNRNENEVTKLIVMAQKECCYKGDFYDQVRKNIIDLEVIDEQMEESKDKLRETLAKKIQESAYTFLINKANNHSKVNSNLYTNCDGAKHYKDPRFTPDLANLLFKFRTRTYLVKNNFRNNYRNTNILCPVCEIEDDTQEHLLKCAKIKEKYGKNITNNIDEIFSADTDTLYNISVTLKDIVEIRNSILNPE